MDPVIGGIIAAGIVAVGSIIGNIILAKSRSTAKQKNKELLEGIPLALENLKKEAEKRQGYSYIVNYAKSKAIIQDFDGTTHIIREYRGLSIVDEGMTLGAIPEEAWVSVPGLLHCQPRLIPQIGSSTFHKQIKLITEKHSERYCKFRIEIEGGLNKSDGEINYGYEYHLTKGILMTYEEALEAYAQDLFKKEYVCFDVRFPANELELEIEFPDRYNVNTFPGVFLGGSETWNDMELQRIKSNFNRTSRGATLKVNNPVLGFRYLIFWEPITREELAQLESHQ